MQPFADHSVLPRRPLRDAAMSEPKSPTRGEIDLKVALATLPLIGLAAGVVGLSLWIH